MIRRHLLVWVLVGLVLLPVQSVHSQPSKAPLLRPDFNNDGIDDLAVGVPGRGVVFSFPPFDPLPPPTPRAGGVQVMLGGPLVPPNGVAFRKESYHRHVFGVPGDPTSDELFGTLVATGDFNGDNNADLVIASPFAVSTNSITGLKNLNIGVVVVIYSTPFGLNPTITNPTAPQELSPVSSAPFGNQFNLFFGASLAVGNFDGDGFADLAIGAPGANGRRGAVFLYRGSGNGLGSVPVILTKSNIPKPPGDGKDGDFFGKALAAGDFNRDGFSDLAIGAPGSGTQRGGIVHIVFGTSDGLKSSASQAFTQDTDLVLGKSEPGDEFGAVLVAGDFDGNGASDLAIGIPGEAVGGKAKAGAVAVLFGFTGLSTQKNQLWHQDVPDVAGAAEAGDMFGARLAAGDFNGDGRSDLAIGVPAELRGGFNKAGVVHVLYGTPNGPSANGAQLWDLNSPGVPDEIESFDTFGAALGVGDFDGNGVDDIVIGVPGKRFADRANAGAVIVLFGRRPNGLNGANAQILRQDGPGTQPEAGARFGSSLSGGDADSPF